VKIDITQIIDFFAFAKDGILIIQVAVSKRTVHVLWPSFRGILELYESYFGF
jgi:hypothetical protein